jgi:hypothetical protein
LSSYTFFFVLDVLISHEFLLTKHVIFLPSHFFSLLFVSAPIVFFVIVKSCCIVNFSLFNLAVCSDFLSGSCSWWELEICIIRSGYCLSCSQSSHNSWRNIWHHSRSWFECGKCEFKFFSPISIPCCLQSFGWSLLLDQGQKKQRRWSSPSNSSKLPGSQWELSIVCL